MSAIAPRASDYAAVPTMYAFAIGAMGHGVVRLDPREGEGVRPTLVADCPTEAAAMAAARLLLSDVPRAPNA